MNKNLKKKKKGFTLVEVIIVLAIIAVIAAIAIPNLTRVRQQSIIKADERSAESLKRTVNMMITNGDLDYPITKDTYIIIEDGKAKSSRELAFADGKKMEDFIEECKAPQQNGMKSFKIKIAKDGEITCNPSSNTSLSDDTKTP